MIKFLKIGTTEPLDPTTFPYLTTENLIFLLPTILLAAVKILSDVSFVAPYKLIGSYALSVERAIIFFTFLCIAEETTFSAPSTFVLMHSIGLYSAISTCFKAAACIT